MRIGMKMKMGIAMMGMLGKDAVLLCFVTALWFDVALPLQLLF